VQTCKSYSRKFQHFEKYDKIIDVYITPTVVKNQDVQCK